MKKNYLKKIFVAVIILLCSVAASAHDFEVGGIYYNITSGKTVAVTYQGNTVGEYKYAGDIIIPESVTYYGIEYNVTSIGVAAFVGCEKLTSIKIGNNITTIEDNAFAFCEGLTSIEIPNGVTSIGSIAFYFCSNLANITIPNSVINIEPQAFEGTLWYDNQPDGVVYAGKVLYEYKGEMTSFTSIDVKEGTLGIGYGAFNDCWYLTTITIPESVKIIGGYAFNNCPNLSNVTISNGVESIEEYAFRGCSGLTSITIPNSVTSIGSSAFQYCYNLTKIYLLRKNPASIDNSVFPHYDATLYVPQGSLEAYKAADVWGDFTNIVEFDATAIEDIEDDAPALKVTAGGIQFTDAEGKAVAVYTATGALVEKIDNYAGEEIALDKGVYIIRVGGKAVKIKL